MGTLLNRRRYMGGKSLPYDYEVEYLESTGTQWINTGINCNSNYTLEVEAQGAQGTEGVIGARVSSSSNMHTFVFPSSRSQVRYSYGGKSLFVEVNLTSFNYYRAEKENYYVNGDLAGTLSAASFTLNFPYYLFALDTNGSVSNLGAKKIKMCRIWDGDSLLLDLIPVRKGQVGYMYDKVSRQLLGNQGTGDFIVGPDSPNKQNTIPVEYLQCTTTQWINTKIVPDFNTTVEVKAALLTNSDCHTVSARTIQGDSGRFFAFSFFGGLQARFVMDDQVTTKPYVIETPYTILFNEQNTHKVYCDNELITEFTSGNTVTRQNPLILFGTSGYGTYPKEGAGINNVRIYYCKIIQNGVLVRDFAPVRKGTTGYMYDSVSDKFFGNNGTGDFVLGPDKT